MAITDWSIGSNKSDGSSGGSVGMPFLYLKEGKYTVRLLKKPVVVGKYFYRDNNNKMRIAIISDKDINSCPIRQKYPEKLKNKASLRYAVKVIDRSDSKVKIMEFPYTVFKAICENSKHHEIDPGSKDGADFTVSVNPNAKGTDRYTVMFDNLNTLTNEEIKLYQATEEVLLETVYKIDSPEEVEKKLFGDPDAQTQTQAPVAQNTEAPSTASESFGSNDDAKDDEVPF